MITARSTLTRNLFRSRKDAQNALAAFVQTPLPSPTSDEQQKPGFARHMTSPAYRRYMQKQKGDVAIKGNQPSIGAAQDGIQIPTNEVARSMGWKFSEMENEALVVIAEMKNHGARVEVLRRHIMATDDIDYEAAGEVIEKIAAKNQDGMTRAALPYKVAIATAVVTGFGAIPMVFSIDVAKWFNLAFVTMEIPEPSDLETALETGAWTWNWMEPVLGTASYTLLCLQVARQNMQNLGIKPYTSRLMEKRAAALYEAFPQYNRRMLHSFVETDAMVKV